MVPTHASIAERLRELDANAAIGDPARIAKERASLIELCHGLGHDHKPQWPYLHKPGPCVGCGTKA